MNRTLGRAPHRDPSRRPSPAAPPAVEPLEGRRLFAVTAGINAAGVLVVQGTPQADTVTLSYPPPAAGTAQKIRVVTAGLDARFTASAVKSITVNAGGGNDVVTVGAVPKPAVLNGGSGNDRLTGGPVADALNGGDGNDVLDGAGGADFLSGGEGQDTASYAARTAGVTVSLDNVANDGTPGEKDDARSDIENLTGGGGNDTLTGDKDSNTLVGLGGNDVLFGGDGNDVLDGGAGADQLYGQAGFDLLDGGTGTDYLTGGAGASDVVVYAVRTNPVTVTLDGVANDGEAGENDFVSSDLEGIIGGKGNDTLTGNAGPNAIYGGAGDDLVNGGGGDDALYGNAGRDRLYGQAGDDTLVGNDDGTDADYLDGGLGADKGYRGTNDAIFSIETLF